MTHDGRPRFTYATRSWRSSLRTPSGVLELPRRTFSLQATSHHPAATRGRRLTCPYLEGAVRATCDLAVDAARLDEPCPCAPSSNNLDQTARRYVAPVAAP